MAIFRELKNVMGYVDPQTQEDSVFDKPYLVLLTEANAYEDNGDDDYRTFDAIAIRGRKTLFDHIVSQLGNYDLIHSYIMSGSIPLGKEVTLYTFLRQCIEHHFRQSSEVSLDDIDSAARMACNAEADLDLIYNLDIGKRVK